MIEKIQLVHRRLPKIFILTVLFFVNLWNKKSNYWVKSLLHMNWAKPASTLTTLIEHNLN